ncbi:MAG: VIT domain-containing protein [Ardenticatenaceae bacterium]
MKRSLTMIWAVVLFVVGVLPAGAQGPIVEPPPDVIIEPMPPGAVGLELVEQRVQVTVDGQVAVTSVAQLFRNPSEWALEGEYLFPLPPDAAISDMDMTVDGEKLEGELMEADEAREIYEEIVRQRMDPALLEWLGNGLFRTHIFPIPPGETRLIELEYTQLLTPDGGLFHYRFPLRQVSPQTLSGEGATHFEGPSPRTDVSVSLELRSEVPLRAIYSPSHEVDIIREGEGVAIVGWEGRDLSLEEDFSLFWSVSPEEIELNLLSFKERGEDGFFLLLAAPTIEPPDEQVVARDVLLVLDVSGSMEGEKIEQAKGALDYVLQNLNPQDRFNVTAFSTGTRRFASQLQPISEVPAARRWVEELEAGGSTDISRALLETLSPSELRGEERPILLIFLTDGLPTAGIITRDGILKAVLEQAPDRVRTFAFGVGYDVDTVLLDSLAAEMRGASGYVTPDERIDEEISAFYAKVSAPVLANVQLDWGDVLVEEIYPSPLPDLFAGQQLVIAGRYREGGPVALTLTGEVNGQTQRFVYDQLRLVDDGERLAAPLPRDVAWLPRLWATRKIGTLLQNMRRHGENREAVEEIIDLAIRYGIVTPYTTFLVDEDQDFFTEEERDSLADQAPPARGGAASGEAAVEESELLMELADSQRAAPARSMQRAESESDDGVMVAPALRTMGAKSFVQRDGRWVDTRYDDSNALVEMPFGSDEYFTLASKSPELARYLSVGVPLIVVVDDTAYLIVENSDGVNLSPGSTEVATPSTDGTDGTDTEQATPKLIAAATTPESSATPDPSATANPSARPEAIAIASPQPQATPLTKSSDPSPSPLPLWSLALIAALIISGIIAKWVMRQR